MKRTALVTGASRGIGRAIALALAGDGVDTIGLHFGSDVDAAKATAIEAEQLGATVVLLQANLTHDVAATAHQLAGEFLDAVDEATGRRSVDVLVFNAGGGVPEPLQQISEASYRQVMDLNFTSALFLLQALQLHLAPDARVVAVSSGFTRKAAPDRIVYGAAKAALENLCLAMAPALGETGGTINAVLPGVVGTERNAGWLTAPQARERVAAMSVFNRVATVDDVAALVRFLASPENVWTTGQVIDVSGGAGL